MGRTVRTAAAGSNCGTLSPMRPARVPSRHVCCPTTAAPPPHTAAGTAGPVVRKQHGRLVLRPAQKPILVLPAPPALGRLGLASHWAFADSCLDPAKSGGLGS